MLLNVRGVQLMTLVSLIERCVQETAAERDVEVPDDFSERTPLFGRDGVFDSMGLVSLVVAVEEAISDEHGEEITLADQRAMSEKKSPFVNTEALAEYAQKLIDEGG